MKDVKELPLPTPVDLPEGYFLKRSLIPGGMGSDYGIEYSIRKLEPLGLLQNSPQVGYIAAHPSELGEDLITMGSHLDPEAQRKGIARSIYKLAEKETGKKIIPDQMLSDMSAPLHKKYGLGNEFGLSSYEENIKRRMEDLANYHNKEFAGKVDSWGQMSEPLWPPEFADQRYKKIKEIMNEVHGLDKFKSFIPFLKPIGMGLTALGAAGYSDPSSAAVDMVIPGGLEEIGQNDREVISDRKYRSANLIPNAGMLGNYTDAPDIGRYHESIRKLQGRGM